MAAIVGGGEAIAYVESRQYTEPLFVFAVMVVTASRPVLDVVRGFTAMLARFAPVRVEIARAWLCVAVVPLLGSLITEPAAMTLAALMLSPTVLFSSNFCPVRGDNFNSRYRVLSVIKY
jgi:hypothetical protein